MSKLIWPSLASFLSWNTACPWLLPTTGRQAPKLHPRGRSSSHLEEIVRRETSLTIPELTNLLCISKKADGCSSRYVARLRCYLKRLESKFSERKVSSISLPEAEDYLRDGWFTGTNRNSCRASFTVAWDWAIGHGYTKENPWQYCAKVRVAPKEPEILTVDEVRQLLANISQEDIPYFTLALFAGIRRSELERMHWTSINWEDGIISLEAKRTKSLRRRHILLRPVLRNWLEPFRGRAGLIVKDKPYLILKRIREGAKMPKGWQFPKNCLRHSFASYHCAMWRSPNELALEMGHQDIQTTFAHYLSLVPKSEAERFWELPNSSSKRKAL